MNSGTILCSSPAYNFEGIFFEVHYWCGPHPLSKFGDPLKNIPTGFYKMYDRFNKLKNKEFYRVGGGCIFI